MWAKAYDRDMTDVFAIQAELSQEIATALKTALSPEEKAMIARRPTDDSAAYDLFLRARDLRNREGATPAARQGQIKLLQSAVELDAHFAQAWAELADAFAFAYFNEDDDKDALLARAKAAMDRAVQLAPDDPEVVGSLGTYYYYGYRDYARAAEQYERLARLQPNDPTIFNSLGLIQRRQGRWAESLTNTRRATELDPGRDPLQQARQSCGRQLARSNVQPVLVECGSQLTHHPVGGQLRLTRHFLRHFLVVRGEARLAVSTPAS